MSFKLQNIERVNFTGTGGGGGVSMIHTSGGVSVDGFIAATEGVSAGTLQLNDGSIQDTTGNISFNSSTLTDIQEATVDNQITIGNIQINNQTSSISNPGSTISFSNTDILVDKIEGTAPGNLIIGSAADTIRFNNAYSFPSTAGTQNQILKLNNTGQLIFANESGGSGGGGGTSINGLSDAFADTTNVVLGNEALNLAGNGGLDNVGVGVSALIDITSGSRNVAIGSNALALGTVISDSIAIGHNSLVSANTGNLTRSIAIGTSALSSHPGGNGGNVAIGYLAGESLTSGQNTIIGASAGVEITSGVQNVIIGCCAAPSLTSGSNNIVIGYHTDVTAGPTTNDNVYLGNGSIQSLYLAGATIFNTSDRRDKTDIEDSSFGLDFIENLRPVEYTWDRRVLNSGDKNCSMNGKRRVGLIAQEVLETMPNDENEILDLVKEENPERYHIGYPNLIPVLVKAVKDLKSEVDTLKQRMDNCSC